MHISLDSALGRQRRLNSVGESVLQIAPDAAAAYSLRSLTGGDPDVVRVRRESDNTEKDFSGSQIESGEMARWVNEQPTLPLDLRELDTNTGERDGALIEAAAAYSLRKLKEDFTGDVVEVRRNVDGETEGFTAAEVTDGTLENWVKGWENYSLSTAKNYTTHPFEEFSSPSSTGFTALNSSAEAFAGWDIPSGSAGDVIEVSFDINITSGTPRVQLRPAYDDRKMRSNIFEIGTSGSYTATLKATGDYSFISFSDADVPSDFTVSNFKVYNNSTVNELPLDQATGASAAYSLRNLSSTGTDVTTSGDTAGDPTGKYVVQVRRSSDNAVQSFTAAEVADGTLESWVNTDVDKLNLQAEAGSLVGNVSNETSTGFDFSVNNEGSTGWKMPLPSYETTAGTYIATFDVVLNSGSLAGVSFRNNSSGEETNLVVGPNSITVNPDGTSNMYFRVLGTAVADVSITNITLTQTTADGHVKTWYDQSGSDNHATQTDAASQPKIVDGGTLLKDSNNNPEVVFTRGDAQFLTASSPIAFNDVFFKFRRTDATNATNGILSEASSGLSPYTYIHHSSQTFSFDGNASDTVNLSFNGQYEENQSTDKGGLVTDDSHLVYLNYTSNPDAISDIGRLYNGSPIYGSFGAGEFIFYNSDQSTKRRAIEENIANHYDISLAAFSRDGTVSTWYDQSGSTNDATQTDPTKQPKIVEGGTLKDHLDFDGNAFMDIGAFLMDGTDASTVMVMSNVDTDVETFYLSNRSGAGGFNFKNDTSNKGKLQYSFIGSGSSTTSNVFVADNTDAKFITTITKDTNDREFFGNGSQLADDGASNTYTQATGTPNTSIGKQGNSSASDTNKKLRVYEIISYNLELEDNRTAIEANIGETYGITDIPAADDTVNGFVQTWYDQSGNGNDAEQSAASSQPKIVGEVTSGQPHAFLGAVVFDQANETQLVVVGNPVITADYTGTYSAFSIQTVSNSEFGYLYGNSSLGSGSSLYNNGNVYAATNKSTASGFDQISKTSEKDLLSAVYNNGDAGLLVNGGGTMIDQGTYDFASGAGNFRIGNRSGGTSGGTYLTGSIEEIIIYNSDQSSNRPAIETNIANQYGITLS